ncbi:hypothetical protein [Aureivirga sp. CE67]|uniref:hypothetical protein n=1 Tax=Aureivirga sp. CE67 TaxID=1788983 RepID=UPI0018C931F2|nr:hypothetical protein [Aureivirga sp. CE67]
MEVLYTILCLFSLIIIHELGHVISALILNLKITKIGFQWIPYPHAYVKIKWPESKTKALIYLLAGSFMTIVLLAISLINNFFGLEALALAFFIQLIIEFNPFYSDFTIIRAIFSERSTNQETHAALMKEQLFTPLWYVHFVAWVFLIFQLKKLLI